MRRKKPVGCIGNTGEGSLLFKECMQEDEGKPIKILLGTNETWEYEKNFVRLSNSGKTVERNPKVSPGR